jgi:glycine/D-amino acid oxidase-like deaminating enzyme
VTYDSGRLTITCDVLVVGGGITGAATALRLAEAGADVVLVERHDLNTQGSGYNAGSLHAQIQHEPFLHKGEAWARAYAPATAFLTESTDLWLTLGGELGEDLEAAILGGILVAENESQMRDIERKVRIEREQGLDVEMLSASDLRKIAPYVSDRMVGGELCRSEGKANPLLATPALARGAKRAGARLLLRTAVEGLERTGDRFSARTSAGVIDARRVVSCGGIDAGHVTGLLGVDLPVVGHPIQASVTEPVEPLVEHLVYFAGDMLTLKQARVGSLLIGGGWPARLSPTGQPVVDPDSLRANLAIAEAVVPALSEARLLRAWAGFVNGVEDWLPIIGEIETVPGLYVGIFPWMGFTAGPLMGRVLADLVLDRPSEHDLAAFSPARF